jgi:hypothetical protein
MIGRRGVMMGALAAGLIGPGAAAALPFDGGWTHQTFPRRTANTWRQAGAAVDVASDSGVSLLIREVPQAQWSARKASWQWQVSEGVPATDLTQKGGDDRNLAVYFVFLPQADAERLKGASPRRVLTARTARTLVYIWGGDAPRGRMLASPYFGDRGRNVILRPAGTGSHGETVDLAADHARAFGGPPAALFGVGLSADSDDTGTRIRARLSGLSLSG